MHHTESQISKRHITMSNQTTLDMLSTKYQNPSVKGLQPYLRMSASLTVQNSITRNR